MQCFRLYFLRCDNVTNLRSLRFQNYPTDQAEEETNLVPRLCEMKEPGNEVGADPENHGLHNGEWAQEEMAAFHRFEENLRHYHCRLQRSMAAVYFPGADIYLFQV